MWVFAILIVLAMGSIAVVAAGRGTPLQEEYDDRPDAFIPPEDEPIGPSDLKAVRFSLAVRGYRMAEVDALLSRLARQLEEATGEPVPLALPAPIGPDETEDPAEADEADETDGGVEADQADDEPVPAGEPAASSGEAEDPA